MKAPNFKSYHIRKWLVFREEVLANETGAAADGPFLVKAAVGAVIQNPYAGHFSGPLAAIVDDSAALGAAFGRRIADVIDPASVQSYGKACIVGTMGEYEHGNAFLTTAFANPVRDAVGGGAAWVPSTGKIGGPGTAIDIPLACKDALYVRSHYDTFTVNPAEAPLPDEVVVLFAFASRGRLHARLGGLAYGDRKGVDGLH